VGKEGWRIGGRWFWFWGGREALHVEEGNCPKLGNSGNGDDDDGDDDDDDDPPAKDGEEGVAGVGEGGR